MTATRERWMLFGACIVTVLFVCFFIMPNYQSAELASKNAHELEHRIAQLELRQIEVEKMHSELTKLESQVQLACKRVPDSPDTAEIVRALSLEVDGRRVLDQGFTAGATSKAQENGGFAIQPLAVTLHADFDSIFSVIRNVESMNRLVRVSSLRITAKDGEENANSPVLEASIGLHAMYDNGEYVR